MTTVQNVIDRVRNQLDNNSGRLSDAVLIDWINDETQELFDELLPEVPDYFPLASQSVNLVSGTESYWTSMVDIAQFRGLDYLVEGTTYRTLVPIDFNDRNEANGDRYPMEPAATGEPTHYILRGENAYIRPVPTASKTNGLRFWYIVEPSRYTAVGNTLETWISKARAESFIVAGCCARSKARDELQEDIMPFKQIWQANMLAKLKLRLRKYHKGGAKTVSMERRPRFGQRRRG